MGELEELEKVVEREQQQEPPGEVVEKWPQADSLRCLHYNV